MSEKFVYDEKFYNEQAAESYQSARIVLQMFKDNFFMPESVLDIGCGVGTWLKAWQDMGVKNIEGIDGNHMPEESLYIPRSKIKIADIDSIAKINNEKYDLAMSLETGEHLLPETIENFVRVLSKSADIILFSSAIPNQHGPNHINEQPMSFWIEHFAKYNFECFDIMRPIFLQNPDKVKKVGWWYIQNMLIFATGEQSKILKSKGFNPTKNPIMFYHYGWMQIKCKGWQNVLPSHSEIKIGFNQKL